jgi:hypothetical protein
MFTFRKRRLQIDPHEDLCTIQTSSGTYKGGSKSCCLDRTDRKLPFDVLKITQAFLSLNLFIVLARLRNKLLQRIIITFESASWK